MSRMSYGRTGRAVGGGGGASRDHGFTVDFREAVRRVSFLVMLQDGDRLRYSFRSRAQALGLAGISFIPLSARRAASPGQKGCGDLKGSYT